MLSGKTETVQDGEKISNADIYFWLSSGKLVCVAQ